MSDELRVLVIGPRRGLLRELSRQRLPYVVWVEEPRRHAGAEAVHVAPFTLSKDGVHSEAARLQSLGPFSHVIAGSEAAVVTASLARRALGARVSDTSVVIRCHDKLEMKTFLAKHDIPMTPFVDPSATPEPDEIIARLGTPLVVKPRTSSGSRDLHIVEDEIELAKVLRAGQLVERHVDAPEASVESFVHEGEIVFENVTEYARKAHVNILPAGLPKETLSALLALNRSVLGALGIRWGMTHLEAFLTDRGPLFGEVALRPPGGYITDLLKSAWDFNPWRGLVAVELGRSFDFPRTCKAHAAALILHPGPGTLRAVHGLDDVRRHPAVVRAKIRIDPGQTIAPRVGVGSDVGHVILRADTREALLAAWKDVEQMLHLEVDGVVQPELASVR